MDMGAVNALPFQDFVSIFGNVVEKSPIIAAAAWARGPFVDLAAMHAAICDFIDALPESGKEALLRCIPDLAGRELQSGTLGRESLLEQVTAGMNRLDSAEASHMARLREEYKERFRFPFVMCARENDKASILKQMGASCKSEHAVERARAINEVKKTVSTVSCSQTHI